MKSILEDVDFSTIVMTGLLFFVLSDFFRKVDKYIDEKRNESEEKGHDHTRSN